MKKIIASTLVLVSLSGFASSEATRLAGSWKGTYIDKDKSATFMLTINDNGSATYSDNSRLGPYCEGDVVRDNKKEIKLELECNKEVSRSFFFSSSKLSIKILDPSSLVVSPGQRQRVTIDSSIMGLNLMNIVKLPSITYADLTSSNGAYQGIFTVFKNSVFVGNMNFELNKEGRLVVNSGFLKITNIKSIFGESEKLIDGYYYTVPNEGSYSISSSVLEMNIQDDSGQDFDIKLDLSEIENQMIYVYNLNRPKDLDLHRTEATINDEEYDVELVGLNKL